MKALLAFLTCAVPAAAESAIVPPQVGYVRDAAGAVRPIYGVAGSFVPGPAMESRATAAAFSGQHGWIKTEDSLLLLDERGRVLERRIAPGSAALFGFSMNGSETCAFLPQTAELYLWAQPAERDRRVAPPSRDRQEAAPAAWRRLRVIVLDPLELAGEAVAARCPGDGQVLLVVRRDQRFWSLSVSLSTGGVGYAADLRHVSTPLLILPDGRLVFGDRDEIVIRKASGEESRFSVGGAVSALEPMSEDWVRVSASGAEPANYALRVLHGEALYRLPEVRP